MSSEHLPLHLPVVVAAASLREAVEVIEQRSASICLLLDGDGRLLGSLSDGDVRRAFLAGATPDDAARPWARLDPTTVPVGTRLRDAVAMLEARRLSELPVVDAAGRPVGLLDIVDLVGVVSPETLAAVCAGAPGAAAA